MGGALGQSHPCHAPGVRTWLKNFITRTLYTVHNIGQEGVVCTGGALGRTYNLNKTVHINCLRQRTRMSLNSPVVNISLDVL